MSLLSFCLFVFLSFCLSVFLSLCLYVFLSFCLSVFMSFCLSVFLSFLETKTVFRSTALLFEMLCSGGKKLDNFGLITKITFCLCLCIFLVCTYIFSLSVYDCLTVCTSVCLSPPSLLAVIPLNVITENAVSCRHFY